MKKRIWKWSLLLLVVIAIALPAGVIAQTTPEQRREAVKEKVLEKGKEVRGKIEEQLTTEQKAELKNRAGTAIDKLQNLTPEQKAEIKKNVTATVEKFKGMTPEAKDALKQELEKSKNLTPEQKNKIIEDTFTKTAQ
jgi:uncharacterized protein YpmS